MEYLKIDRKSPVILAALAKAPVYKKQGVVKARPAVPGEQVTTILAKGTKETTNTAKEGAWVMVNPSGELYIIEAEKFFSRYEATATLGVYEAKGYCRAIPNPFGRPIEITASWGSPQQAGADCRIADVCEKDGAMDGEPYLIDAGSFVETYKQVVKCAA